VTSYAASGVRGLNRRQALRAAAAGAACAVAPVVRAERDAPPIIDTHQHLWDLNRFRLPWLKDAGEVLNRTYTTEDYLKAAAGLNVVRAVYVEVDVEPAQRERETEYVIDLCRRKVGPTVAAVVGGATEQETFPQSVSRHKDGPYVKGVRSSFDAGLAAGEVFVKNLRALGAMGMSFDINSSGSGLERAAAVAEQCPDTVFVVDHCGNIGAEAFRRAGAPAGSAERRNPWQRAMTALAGRQNVVCKISGVMEAARTGLAGEEEYAAVINHCLEWFGPDRVIFASNWPVVNRAGSFGAWVKLLRSVTAGRPAADVRKLFSDNAIRHYRLGAD
jgi:predicted TIM-barrel fold metal-dependent hydrolase